MGEKKSFVEHSKDSWVTGDMRPDKPNLEQLMLGCLQRVASATETMAKSYNQVRDDRDWFKKKWNEAREEVQKLQRRINSYKGHKTRRRLKK